MVPPDDKPGGIRGNRPRLRGEVTPRSVAPIPQQAQPVQPAPAPVATKRKVLFVCIGNSCRSQMAEAFAKAYGADIMQVQSAGLSPAMSIAPMTGQMLAQRNLNLNGHFPKNIELVQNQMFDLIVNISGHPLNVPGTKVITWTVQDPIGQKEAVYQQVISQIESLVMSLILTLRSGRLPA